MHAQVDFEQIVEIESNEVALDIPDDGITTQAGWKISPLGPPVVRRTFFIDAIIFYCMLTITDHALFFRY